MTEQHEDWLVLRVPTVEPDSFELQKLSHLLNDLSSALFSIARGRLGMPTDRPGPRTSLEEGVAGFRLISIAQGSLLIELEPPPKVQGRLDLPGEVEPEDVAYDLYRLIEQVTTGPPPPETDREILRRVMTVVSDFSEMGSSLEIEFHPRKPERLPEQPSELRGTFNTAELYELPEVAPRRERKKVIGHAYMVDIEPGKQRLRLKLPDGRDLTLSVDEESVTALESALNQDVEVEIEEGLEGDTLSRRVVQEVDILVSPTPSTPKTIEELEAEQELTGAAPDYVSLASSVWRSEEEVHEFEEHIRQIRRAQS